jgi:polyphosphate kinase
VAPLGLREQVVELIGREGRNAQQGRPARIIVKMNALVEPTVIDALYRAAQAGVRIDLVVRGTCSLRPGIPGLSENIRVISIVDRFLEHSRIFYFENAGDPEVFLGSADWMPRNFYRRIELMFPVEDAKLKTRLINGLLPVILKDNVKARQLQSDGTYVRLAPAEGQEAVRSQAAFQAQARESARVAVESGLQFVPIFGETGAPPADETGAHGTDSGQRTTPPRVRSPRSRKRPEPA